MAFIISHSLCRTGVGKGLPGWFWLRVSHAVAIRRLELTQQRAERGLCIFLSSRSLRASSCGLLHGLLWVLKCVGNPRAVGLFTWPLKASWASISVNKMKTEFSFTTKLQKLCSITSAVLLVTIKSEVCPDSRGRELTSPLAWGASSSWKSIWS